MKNTMLRRKNIPMRIAGVLLLLAIVLAYSMTGLYAKYVNSDSGNDTARVARFEIEDDLAEQVTTKRIRMAPGESDAYAFQITNKSEVGVKYTLEVIRETENLPIVITPMNETGEIAANAEAPAEVTLNVSWPTDVEGNKDYRYSHEIDLITIKLTAEQID